MLLNKLNRICNHFGIDFLFDDIQSISNHDAVLIHALCDFIDTGCMKTITPNATISATLILSPKLFRSLKEKPNPVDTISCKGKDHVFKLLGENVVLKNIQTELQNMKLIIDPSNLHKEQIGKDLIP